MFVAALPNRGIIRVSGEDARSFLQGVITNDINLVNEKSAVYACFLTPQGKYLADFFVYPHLDGVLLDVDKKILSELLKRMSLFKLRSRVVLEDVSDQYTVTAIWGTGLHPEHAVADPRASVMGYRMLNGAAEGETGDYYAWQMQNGIADVGDFERERTTMLEANMDFLNAISFTKGCYLGQEITARMHYRGLVKKRFLPLVLSEARHIVADTPITRDGKTIGFLRGCKGTHAIGVMQLEALEQGDECLVGDIAAEIKMPEWLKL